jgi:hypothetical protein
MQDTPALKHPQEEITEPYSHHSHNKTTANKNPVKYAAMQHFSSVTLAENDWM